MEQRVPEGKPEKYPEGHPESYMAIGPYLDWGAIIVGFVVAMVVMLLLSLIMGMTGTANPVLGYIIDFVSLLCGGWVTGYLAPHNGLLHGTFAAILTVIVTAILAAVAASAAALVVGTPAGIFIFLIPTGIFGGSAAAAFLFFIIQLIGGAIGGYLGEMSAGRPVART